MSSLEQKTQYQEKEIPLSWYHIVNAINHEMSLSMGATMLSVIQDLKVNGVADSFNPNDLSSESVQKVIGALEGRINLSTKRLDQIKDIIDRACTAFSISQNDS